MNFKVDKINFLMLEKSTFKVGDKINFNVGKIYFNEKSIYMVYVGYVWCMLSIHGRRCMLNIRYVCSVNSVC